jgi:hypothetical protein
LGLAVVTSDVFEMSVKVTQRVSSPKQLRMTVLPLLLLPPLLNSEKNAMFVSFQPLGTFSVICVRVVLLKVVVSRVVTLVGPAGGRT